MSTTLTSDGLSPRRKKALYYAWRRGTKEMDILLGTYADARLPDMSEAALDQFETLMAETDRDLFAWIVGSEPVPADLRTAVFDDLVLFHHDKHKPAA